MANPPEAIITVTEDNECPMYALGNQFILSGRALSLPVDRAACTTLVEDILQVRSLCESLADAEEEGETENMFQCSGPTTDCTGSLGLKYRQRRRERELKPVSSEWEKAREKAMDPIVAILKQFSMFQSLGEPNLRHLASFLELRKYGKGEMILQRGTPGTNLFIMASGRVAVIGEDGLTITHLETGEVFGEMSLLSGDAVGATIRATEPTRVLSIPGKDLRKILNRYPSLQMYFARLLARRLAQTNISMTREAASAMTGRLSDISAAELFQTFHQNQKTGILEVTAARGKGRFSFLEGDLVAATYAGASGKESFYEILKEKEGRFKFSAGLPEEEQSLPPLGDFMWLLMDGLNKIDEASR